MRGAGCGPRGARREARVHTATLRGARGGPGSLSRGAEVDRATRRGAPESCRPNATTAGGNRAKPGYISRDAGTDGAAPRGRPRLAARPRGQRGIQGRTPRDAGRTEPTIAGRRGHVARTRGPSGGPRPRRGAGVRIALPGARRRPLPPVPEDRGADRADRHGTGRAGAGLSARTRKPRDAGPRLAGSGGAPDYTPQAASHPARAPRHRCPRAARCTGLHPVHAGQLPRGCGRGAESWAGSDPVQRNGWPQPCALAAVLPSAQP